MFRRIVLSAGFLSAFLIAGQASADHLYNCSCIGWQADQAYHPCSQLNNGDEEIKRGTRLSNVSIDDLPNLIQKHRLKYFEKGAVYEPETGWYCNRVDHS